MRLLVYRLLDFLRRRAFPVLAVSVSLLLVAIASQLGPGHRNLADVLAYIVDSPRLGSVLTLIGALTLLAPAARLLQNWILGLQVPVNLRLDERFRTKFADYIVELRREISQRMPKNLSGSWDQGPARIAVCDELIPLEANEESYDPDTKKFGKNQRVPNPISFIYAEYLLDAKQRRAPVLLQGDPGSGKSTLVFELCRVVCSHLNEYKRGWVPLVLFAQDFDGPMLANAETLQELVHAYLTVSNKEFAQLVDDSYGSTSYFVIIDGLDEITDKRRYTEYVTRLNALLTAERNDVERRVQNRYLVTCRTEDNQGLIVGHLFSLMPLAFKTVRRHLTVQLQRERNSSRKVPLENTLENLTRGQEQRLLQNYVENPYLFSVIAEYYRDKTVPPAEELRAIFEHVLTKEVARELSKNLVPHEAGENKKQRKAAAAYVEKFMAPLCFGLTANRVRQVGELTPVDDFRLFEEFLPKDLQLYGPIREYVQALHDYSLHASDSARSDSVGRRRERAYAGIEREEVLGELAQPFADHLSSTLSPNCSVEELQRYARRYLHDDVKRLVKSYGLASFDSSGRILRFKHNRLREYFSGLFVDRVGLDVLNELGVDWSNAWLVEPLRIYAALTKTPVTLLQAYIEKLRLAEGELGLFLLEGASHAVAYLPNNQEPHVSVALRALVKQLGGLTMAPFVAKQPGCVEDSSAKPGDLQLQLQFKARMRILRNLFASEFFRRADSMASRGYAQNSDWYSLHLTTLQMPPALQQSAYQCMFPIAAAHTSAGVRPRALFFYVFEQVFCFLYQYRCLVADLRPNAWHRILPWLGLVIEKLPAFGALAGCCWLLMRFTPRVGEVVAAAAVAILSYCAVALLAKSKGWFDWTDLWHAPTMLVFWLVKRAHRVWLVHVHPALWNAAAASIRAVKASPAWAIDWLSKCGAFVRALFAPKPAPASLPANHRPSPASLSATLKHPTPAVATAAVSRGAPRGPVPALQSPGLLWRFACGFLDASTSAVVFCGRAFVALAQLVAMLLAVATVLALSSVLVYQSWKFAAARLESWKVHSVQRDMQAFMGDVRTIETRVERLVGEISALHDALDKPAVDSEGAAALKNLQAQASQIQLVLSAANATHQGLLDRAQRLEPFAVPPVAPQLDPSYQELHRLQARLDALVEELSRLAAAVATAQELRLWITRCHKQEGEPRSTQLTELRALATNTESLLRSYRALGTRVERARSRALLAELDGVRDQCDEYIAELEKRRAELQLEVTALEQAAVTEARRREQETRAQDERAADGIARERLRKEAHEVLEGRKATDFNEAYERLRPLIATADSLMPDLERFERSQRDGEFLWAWEALKLGRALQDVGDLRAIPETDVSTITTYRAALNDLLQRLTAARLDAEWETRLKERIAVVAELGANLTRVRSPLTDDHWQRLRDRAQRLEDAADAARGAQTKNALMLLGITVLAALAYGLYRAHGERRGLKQVESLPDDEIMAYLGTNPFGLSVNEFACRRLKALRKLPENVLSVLSSISLERANRGGNLNTRIHHLLDETGEHIARRLKAQANSASLHVSDLRARPGANNERSSVVDFASHAER